ncbi:phospholipase D-like domain-containing protein [Pedobacter chitinilyticus]|uniref:phospholipase D n=1 Tax=Pedobacter chitinilyticus TaxID=2233776 RepID=A0A3S3PUB4_9SPHI|nr:phospholipase D-like domain-containing protein [Pedobacter chitinilyticus]RWU08169.1 DUF1669 domain-containing protein [Pedobacter chitinilyticus]
MEIFFDQLEQTLIRELESARKSLQIVVGWLDFRRFEATFINLAKKGVDIKIVVGKNNDNDKWLKGTSLGSSKAVDIRFIKVPRGYGILHHKFCIIDSKTVITGSYNWTYTAASDSFENFVIIRDQERVVDRFSDEFDVVFHMTEDRLYHIQHLENCTAEKCKGKLVNILVYQDTSDKYGDVVGDIIEVCSEEPYEHYRQLDEVVIDPNLNRMAEEFVEFSRELYDQYQDEQLTKEDIDERIAYHMDRRFVKYSNTHVVNIAPGITLHGWGMIRQYPLLHKHDDPENYVKIYWKDRFVSDQILDEYEDTFSL